MLKYDQYNLLVEKRIGQIVSNINVNYSLDVITTIHSFERSKGLRDLQDYDKTPVSNKNIEDLISYFKRDIAEKIFYGDIKNEIDFVVKSSKMSLSVAITPHRKTNSWWDLIIKTVFRESDKYSLNVGKNQIVISDI